MDGSEDSKSAPSLDVFAPTSKRAPTRFRPDQKPRSQLTGNNRPASGSEPVIASNPQTRIRRNGRSGFAIDTTNTRSSLDPAGEPEEAERSYLLARAINGLPSWLVSLTVHLALFLILAISSFGIGTGDRRLELEFADSPAQFEMITTELEFDDVQIEDEQELLSPDQTVSVETEDVVIPLEMMEMFTAPQEDTLASSMGPIAGLPGRSASRSGQKGKSAKFFGTKSYGSRFVFVIDCSLSMKGNRWYHAVRELNTAIAGLEPNQEFLVLLYNSRTSAMMDTRANKSVLVPATQDNCEACREWLRKKRPSGGTFPANSMFIALSLNPDAVFLLSDGELQDNTREMLQFWNSGQASYDGSGLQIPIHTVSLGRQSQGKEVMKAIADENSGEFTWIQ